MFHIPVSLKSGRDTKQEIPLAKKWYSSIWKDHPFKQILEEKTKTKGLKGERENLPCQ